MTIELNSYGLTIDSNYGYLALSWQLLIAAALLTIGYKVYKRVKGNK